MQGFQDNFIKEKKVTISYLENPSDSYYGNTTPQLNLRAMHRGLI